MKERSVLLGCADMFKEAAKQFRLLGDNGHAIMCERHSLAARREACETCDGTGLVPTQTIQARGHRLMIRCQCRQSA